MGDQLFHAERPTDITELIIAFRNSAKLPNKLYEFFILYKQTDS
jgi:hypothetical protein